MGGERWCKGREREEGRMRKNGREREREKELSKKLGVGQNRKEEITRQQEKM